MEILKNLVPGSSVIWEIGSSICEGVLISIEGDCAKVRITKINENKRNEIIDVTSDILVEGFKRKRMEVRNCKSVPYDKPVQLQIKQKSQMSHDELWHDFVNYFNKSIKQ